AGELRFRFSPAACGRDLDRRDASSVGPSHASLEHCSLRRSPWIQNTAATPAEGSEYLRNRCKGCPYGPLRLSGVVTPPAPLTLDALHAAVEELARGDDRLASIVERHGPPPLWDRPPGFPTLVHIILEQQVSLASAAALFARLEHSVGGALTPERVLAIGEDGLRERGLTRQKASYVANLADHIVRGELSLPGLELLSDDAAAERLMRLAGIGAWSAGIYLLMALRRPDVWPPGDLALD